MEWIRRLGVAMTIGNHLSAGLSGALLTNSLAREGADLQWRSDDSSSSRHWPSELAGVCRDASLTLPPSEEPSQLPSGSVTKSCNLHQVIN
jgi:hypothetical protein